MTEKTKRKPLYQVVLTVEASRLDKVDKEIRAVFGESVRSVRKVDLSKSRADRLDDIAGEVQDSASSVEELKDELQEWFDNLPENFQNGDKGSDLQEAIDALESLQGELEGLDFGSVSFPSMMG